MSILKTKISANLFRGMEAVGGKLELTDDGLLFTPHSINLQTQIELIPYTAIIDMEKCQTLWVIPNGIRIVCQNKSYHFVVWKRNKLISMIQYNIHFLENLK